MPTNIVQIVRTPVGGIRKHLLMIMQGCPEVNFTLITNFAEADQQFTIFRKSPPDNVKQIINLPIAQSPQLKDLYNLYHLFKLLRSSPPTAIHGHGAKGGLYARIIGHWLNIPVFYTAHGGALHPMHGKIKNILYRFIEKGLYHWSTYLLFESQFSLQQYATTIHPLTERFILNRNAINYPQNCPHRLFPDKNDHILLGAFGLLRPIKGHHLILPAIKKLNKQGYNLTLHIFGEGPAREHLQQQIHHLQLENNVILQGHTTDVTTAMQRCDIIIHPSLFESFGYVPLEAMALKIPVISSLAGGLNEISDGGKNIWPLTSLTPDNIAQTIANCINHSSLRQQKVELARKFVAQNFNTSNFIKKIKELYQPPQPLVTICIPTFNVEKTIAATLNSLVHQSYPNIIIKIFDNNSEDRTIEIIQKWQEKYPHIQLYINSSNIGGEGNFTKCLQAAQGKYTAIFHADDIYLPHIIKEQVAYLEANKQLSAVATHAKTIDMQEKINGKRFLPYELRHKKLNQISFTQLWHLTIKYGNFITCPSVLAKSDIYRNKIIHWNGEQFKTSADLDVWLRLAKYGDIGFISSALIHYRVATASYSFNLKKGRTHRHDIFLVLEHYKKSLPLNSQEKLYYHFLELKDHALIAHNAAKHKKYIPFNPWKITYLQIALQDPMHSKLYLAIIAIWIKNKITSLL